MRSATVRRIALSAASGMYPASGAARNTTSEEHERVDDRRDRCARAGANVRRRARDRARGGDAAGERAKNIRDSLGHQFLVGIVARIGHAVGDHRGEERFDRAQRGNGEGGSHQIAHGFERNGGKMQAGQSAGMPPKRLSIVATGQPAKYASSAVDDHGDDARRHALGHDAATYRRSRESVRRWQTPAS